MIDYQFIGDQIKTICLTPSRADGCLEAIDAHYQDSTLSSLCRQYVNLLCIGEELSPVQLSKFRFLSKQIHLPEDLQLQIEQYLSGNQVVFEDVYPLDESRCEESSQDLEADVSIVKNDFQRTTNSSKTPSSAKEGAGKKRAISLPTFDWDDIWARFKQKTSDFIHSSRRFFSSVKGKRVSYQWDRRLLYYLFKIITVAILILVATVGMKSLPQKKWLFLLVLVITGFGILKTKSLGSLSGMVVFCCIWSLAIVMGVLLHAPLWLMLIFILGGTGYIVYSSYF
jgi:hypothetical protein